MWTVPGTENERKVNNMLKHVSCDLSKDEILRTIVKVFDRLYEAAEEIPTDENTWKKEGLQELLKELPIYEYN